MKSHKIWLAAAEPVCEQAETIELASRAVGRTDNKGHLLALAEKWLDLADRAHRLTERFGAIHRDHPLVNAKLGERTDAD